MIHVIRKGVSLLYVLITDRHARSTGWAVNGNAGLKSVKYGYWELEGAYTMLEQSNASLYMSQSWCAVSFNKFPFNFYPSPSLHGASARTDTLLANIRVMRY